MEFVYVMYKHCCVCKTNKNNSARTGKSVRRALFLALPIGFANFGAFYKRYEI